MRKIKELLYAWWPAIVWMLVIFVVSSRERVAVSEKYVVNFLIFKTLHIIEYGILFLLYARALWRTFSRKEVVNFHAIAFILTILYAVADEIHQTFIPTREGKLRDVIIDGIGAILAWYGLIHWLPKMPPKLQKWAKNWGIS